MLARRPALGTVFVSGYAPPMLLATERFPSQVPVVDKPSTAQALTEVVDAVLAAAPAPCRPNNNGTTPRLRDRFRSAGSR